MKMENDRLIVEATEMGAELTRIYDKEKQAEILWEADRYTGRGIRRCFSRM